MCAETSFLSDQLVQPIFISEKVIEKKNIPGLGDNYVFSVNDAIKQIENDVKKTCRNFLLFLIPGEKNEYNFNLNFHSQTISQIKKIFKEDIFLWSDVCLCSMTTHGHCCIFDNKKKIDNEKSLTALSEIAVAYADSGIDGVAPSDMMDGRSKKIRVS